MNTIVSIHQPNYLPWVGFFHKMSLCNKFVFLDNVPFTKNGFQNRCKIKNTQGLFWLTVPVLHKGLLGQMSYDVKINNSVEWRRKHWNAIYLNYHKAPFFSKYAEFFENIYKKDWTNLLELNLSLIDFIIKNLGIEIQIFLASKLNCSGKGTTLLLNICKEVSADVYLSGSSGRKYLDEREFKEDDIELRYHEFSHPIYNQLYREFIPNASIIDLMFNHGQDSINILRSKNKESLIEK